MSEWKYVLCEPTLDAEDREALLECFDSGWLSTGPRVRAFEDEFAAMHGVKHAIAVANGTAALHLALAALDVGASPDDEVVQPSLTFVAGANMTRALGAIPVFADIVALDEPTVSPAEIARRITDRTRAVMVMHYGGYPARMQEIMAICQELGIPLIEDACHAPGQPATDLGGRFLGTLGDIGCFSFFSNKNLTCGEGGMVVTDNDALAAKVRAMRSHGMTTLSWDRHKGRASTYDVTCHGFNYRMDDLRAALGRSQLAKLGRANARRRDVAEAYRNAVGRLGRGRVSYVFGDIPRGGTGHIAAIRVPAAERDRVREELTARRIQNSLHYPPIHRFSAFAGAEDGICLPLTEAYSEQVITLPIYPDLPDDAPDAIIGAVCDILENAELIVAV